MRTVRGIRTSLIVVQIEAALLKLKLGFTLFFVTKYSLKSPQVRNYDRACPFYLCFGTCMIKIIICQDLNQEHPGNILFKLSYIVLHVVKETLKS